MKPEYISEAKLAELTGYKLKTIRNWRSERKMPPAFKGPKGEVYYLKADADAWIEKLYTPLAGR